MMKQFKFFCLFFILTLSTAAQADFSLINFGQKHWPDIPYPDDSRVVTAGDNMKVNGIPTRIYLAQIQRSMDDSIRFYQQNLRYEFLLKTLPNQETMLSFPSNDGYFTTIRLRMQTSNTTVATVTISDLHINRQPAFVPYEFDLPLDAKVISDVESIDDNKQARHLLLASPYDSQSVKQELTERLAAAGYRPARLPPQKDDDMEIMEFQGQDKHARMVLRPRGEHTMADILTIHE